MDSVDSIDRLVEIEHQAADIIHDAEVNASKSVLDAKTQTETFQNQKIAQVHKELEADYTIFLDSLQKQSQKDIDGYKKNLTGIPLNHAAIAKALEGILSTEA